MKLTKVLVFITAVVFLLIEINAREIDQKTVNAYKIREDVTIDGILKEDVWQKKGCDRFTQSDPIDGAEPTEKTVVWVAFDRKAVYIAARLSDSQPEKITGRLGRRDDFVESDWFITAIDSYFDRRSGFQFAVNPKGSIMDWTIYNDEYLDSTWDGVWESEARIDDKGWTVEIRIPFHQLRFRSEDDLVWGINFYRIIKRKNEKTWYSWKPKEESGYASRFARLEGITRIKTGRNIEWLPYAVTKAAFSPEEEGNPFRTGEEFSVNAGIDLKICLKSNLTLAMTFNPDFGQVEVDPAVINLTAAETYYAEKRNFFIEGADIFRFGTGGVNKFSDTGWAPPRFFYSRRIGSPPRGRMISGGHVDYPEWATILAAVKLTGKTGKGWNIGFLNALTEREYARIDSGGSRSSEEVEPFSYYGVLRAQREFNESKQGFGFIATSVLRNLRNKNLEDTLGQDAFSLGLDGWTFLDKNRTWVLTGWLGAARVSGSKTVIANLQESYPHYFQRPDASHLGVDRDAQSLSGWAGKFILNKQKGNFLFNASIGAISPGFDSTDMGYQTTCDVVNAHLVIGYRSFKPGKVLRSWALQVFPQIAWDFDGNKIFERRPTVYGHLEFLNYWRMNYSFSYDPSTLSKEQTRGGPLVSIPASIWADFNVSTDSRKPFVVAPGFFIYRWDCGSNLKIPYIEFRRQLGSRFSISVSPEYEYRHKVAQWVTNVGDEMMADTFGTRYIFAELLQKTFSCSIRINWLFSPRFSLQAYLQPFITAGDYNAFKELARPKSFDFNPFDTINSTIHLEDGCYNVDPDGEGEAPPFSFYDPDFSYKSLRGTVVLRWEYRPGSALYVVWTQNRADYTNPGDFNFGRDFGDLLSARGENIFMVKLTYLFK